MHSRELEEKKQWVGGWERNEQCCDTGFAQQTAAVIFVLESLFHKQIGKLFNNLLSNLPLKKIPFHL